METAEGHSLFDQCKTMIFGRQQRLGKVRRFNMPLGFGKEHQAPRFQDLMDFPKKPPLIGNLMDHGDGKGKINTPGEIVYQE